MGVASSAERISRATHCYAITHGGIRMWPPVWEPATSEAEARAQMSREECGSLGVIQLWQYDLVKDATGNIVGYAVDSKKCLDTKICAE